MYKLLQNQALNTYSNEINKLGWGGAIEKYPAVEAHFAASFGADKFSLSYLEYYTLVAEIKTDNMEEAFHAHNMRDESKITRYGRQHSMSVGDLLVDENNNIYMCDRFGFSYVGSFA